MAVHDRAVGAICFAVACFILLAPAIWNGFPLLQWDSGGYIARAFEPYLVPSRSVIYGYFAAFSWPLNYWPVAIIQSATAAFVLSLALRVFGLGKHPYALPVIVGILCVATTLPWIAGNILTDIFAGLSVVGLHLLVAEDDKLTRIERGALVVVVAFAVASHSATFAILLGLLTLAAIVFVITRRFASSRGLTHGAAAIVLGVILTLAANFAIERRIMWTPGGYGIVFGRMLEAGIVHRYLDDHCPHPALRLCAHRRELPRNADAFLWGEGLFNDLGRFKGLGSEMRAIVLGSLRAYPVMQIKEAIKATALQLVSVASGEGVRNDMWHTYAIIQEHTPAAVPAMRAARQQKGEIGFETMNRLHVPVALLSMALLPVLILFGIARPAFADLSRLGATIVAAILLNAVVCGMLANPHDRYGARLAWIALFSVILVPARVLARRAHGVPVATGQAETMQHR